MKLFLKSWILIAAVSAAPLFAADEPAVQTPPMPLIKINALITNRIKTWQTSSVRPLSETVKAPFASHGWRVEYTRPMEATFETGRVHSPGDAPQNTAELIAVSVSSGVSAAEIRPKLVWRSAEEELFTTICYLGRAYDFELFMKSDISTIAAMKSLLKPENGENVYEIYAKALNESDFKDYSRRAAPHLLAQGGNSVIPIVNRKVAEALSKNSTLAPHFITLKLIDTPESVAALEAALKSPYKEAAATAEEVIIMPPVMKNGVNLYLNILNKRHFVSDCISAVMELKQGNRMLPLLERLAADPRSYVELSSVVFAMAKIKNKYDVVPEADLVNRIRLLMARAGDLPGSPKMVSVSEQANQVEAKLITAERERVAPLEQAFAKTTNVDCAIVSALSLCVYAPTDRTIDKNYIKRINEEGLLLLKKLPRSRVREILNRLKRCVEHPDEADFFAAIAVKI